MAAVDRGVFGMKLAVCFFERFGDSFDLIDDIHGFKQERIDSTRVAHESDDRLLLAAADVRVEAFFVNPAHEVGDGLIGGSFFENGNHVDGFLFCNNSSNA